MAANIKCPNCHEYVMVASNVFQTHYVNSTEGIRLCLASGMIYNAPPDISNLENITILENAALMATNAKAIARVNMEEAKTPAQLAAALAVSHVISTQSDMIRELIEKSIEVTDKIKSLTAEMRERTLRED